MSAEGRRSRLRGAIGVAVAAAGVLAFAPVFASTDINGGATVSEVAVRDGNQVQVTPPPPRPAPATATYRVSLNFNWTNATHPGTLPNNAHFSGPVIAVHSTPGAMFERGALASTGIENMAETGSQSVLRAELAANPAVSSFNSTGGTGTVGTGTRSFDITVTQGSHLVSMVSMIAPSPDWFIGMRNFDLFVDGAWVGNQTINAANYDSGTDSGPGFTSANADTNPAQPISGPVDAAFINAAGQNPFGTITITRLG